MYLDMSLFSYHYIDKYRRGKLTNYHTCLKTQDNAVSKRLFTTTDKFTIRSYLCIFRERVDNFISEVQFYPNIDTDKSEQP